MPTSCTKHGWHCPGCSQEPSLGPLISLDAVVKALRQGVALTHELTADGPGVMMLPTPAVADWLIREYEEGRL